MITRRGFLQSCGVASLSFGLYGCAARSLPIRIDQQQYERLTHLPFSGLITSLREEYDYDAEIEGSLPVGLRGTLYRNGVGLLERNGLRKRALMDGDGMVHAYFFHEHGVRFKNRFVQTEKFVAESAAGSYLYPTFSTQAPGGLLANIWGGGRIKSQAQISVVVWNNRLYAFDESSYPYELDRTSLETIGDSHLGLPGGTSLFSAHSKINLHAREWMLFGLHYGRKVTLYTTIISENGKVLTHRQIPLPRYVYMHDFLATEKHLIFILHPLEFKLPDFLFGIQSMSDSLVWRPEKGNLVLVLDRTGYADPLILDADACFLWHTLNAYEEDGKILADFVGYDAPDHFIGPDAPIFSVMKGKKGSYTSPGILRRYTIDPARRTLHHAVLCSGNHEWPSMNPHHRCHPYRFGYLASAASDAFFWSGISRIDTITGNSETYDFGNGLYCGEPLFVPAHRISYSSVNTGEPGWLMTEVYNGMTGRSFLAVFESQDIRKGPISRIHLRHHLPYSMHGFWQHIDNVIV